MGKLSTLLLAAAVAAAASVHGAAVDMVRPRSNPPDSPAIQSVTFSGSGCPQGSRNPMSVDATSLNFAFTAFDAELQGAGDSTACQVHLSLSGGGAGWQLSLETVTVSGQLSESVGSEVGFYTTAYWSQDAPNTVNKEWRISNSGGWSSKQVNVRSQLQSVSPCGSLGILNVNFRAALTAGSSAAFGAIDDDTPITEKLQFAWKAC